MSLKNNEQTESIRWYVWLLFLYISYRSVVYLCVERDPVSQAIQTG